MKRARGNEREGPSCSSTPGAKVFVVDFFVASRRLVIEVDGGVHRSTEARARDALRDAELGRLYGVRVLRIDAELVENDVFAAVALVRAAL